MGGAGQRKQEAILKKEIEQVAIVDHVIMMRMRRTRVGIISLATFPHLKDADQHPLCRLHSNVLLFKRCSNHFFFEAEKGEGGEAREHERHVQRSDRICHGTAKGKTAMKHFFLRKGCDLSFN